VANIWVEQLASECLRSGSPTLIRLDSLDAMHLQVHRDGWHSMIVLADDRHIVLVELVWAMEFVDAD
jgi:hypothetical protein